MMPDDVCPSSSGDGMGFLSVGDWEVPPDELPEWFPVPFGELPEVPELLLEVSLGLLPRECCEFSFEGWFAVPFPSCGVG